MVGIGGTYYWNPGSQTAPPLTFTGMYGRGKDVWRFGPPLGSFNGGLVYRRDGMTSGDSLGWGTNSNVSTVLPSVTVNTSIPSVNGIPQPTKNKVSSIEAGLSNSVGASRSTTYTATPQQIADFLIKYGFVQPAMGPRDELSPFARRLQSGVGAVGRPSQAPVSVLASRAQNPLGGGMAGWDATVGTAPDPTTDANRPSGSSNGATIGEPPASAFVMRAPPIPYPPAASQAKPGGILGMLIDAGHIDPVNPDQPPPGGLLGLIQDHLRNNPGAGR
jgi:hypothetical protein